MDEHAKSKSANKRPRSPVAPPHTAAPPLFPPPLTAEDWAILVAWVEEAVLAREDAVVIVSVDDSLIDRIIGEDDDSQVRALHLLPGTYFNTGAVHHVFVCVRRRMVREQRLVPERQAA